MKAFALYIRTHGLTVADYDQAMGILGKSIKASLPQALADARAAYECGMKDAAQTTFLLSMTQAGVEAAKEYGLTS